jgi:beta-N-acetylhexosaminidase
VVDRARVNHSAFVLANLVQHRRVAFGLGLAVLLTACGSTRRVSIPPTTSVSFNEAPTPTGARATAPGDISPSRLQQLTVAQLAGQRVIYSYSGLQPPRDLLERIRQGEAAGVIFFAPNIASVVQLRQVVRELRAAGDRSPVKAPLLMMTDQEGGQVRRLPGGPYASEKQIGASPDGAQLAALAGSEAAETLRAAGLNTNLAPVLDVYREAGNFIDQYERSYSSSSALVSRLGSAFIAAQQAQGVAATAKHFPGLGSATREQDTDESAVTMTLSLAQLRDVDERPYKAAIRAGVRLIMLSWGTYPALDSNLPAGLSGAVIQGELRGRLGFRGVTITDSIGAGALAPFGPISERAALAAAAGEDLILGSGRTVSEASPTIGASAVRGIAAAITARELPRSNAEADASRVIALRETLR